MPECLREQRPDAQHERIATGVADDLDGCRKPSSAGPQGIASAGAPMALKG